MEHVREGFGVHQTMFNRDFENQSILEIFGSFKVSFFEEIVDRPSDAQVICVDLGDNWPVRRRVAGQSTVDRIYSKCKEVIKRLVKRVQTQRGPCQKVPVECFEVSKIKNDSVPFNDRPFIDRLRVQHRKECVRQGAGLLKT